MERLFSLPKKGFEAGAGVAGAGVKGTQEGLRYGYERGAQLTENTGDVVNNIYRRAEAVQRNFFRAFVSEEDSSDPENVIQIDGSFGSIGPKHVCLRIETAQQWELQLAKFVSTFFTLFIAGVIIALIVIKANVHFRNVIGSSTYFVWNVAVASLCLVCCLTTLVAFVRRYFLTKTLDLEWSQRRWRLSLQALSLLIVQIVNLCCMIVGLGLIIPSPCQWRNHASSILGIVQWTCWNTTFMILVAMAHSLTILRRKKADTLLVSSKRVRGTQLVVDSPLLAVHWEKIMLWVFFEAWPVLLMWSFWGFLTDSCAVGRELDNCTLSSKSVAFVAMLIVSCGLYMIVYLFYSSRTKDDVESRSYAEMKFVRIAYGIQHSYILPLFLVLMFSIIVLTAVNINTCWTYVEQWLGLSAWQATGTICACTMSYFFMPVVGRDRGAILSLLQDFCWNQKAEQGEKAARDEVLMRIMDDQRATGAPMFCVETCIRHLYLANYVYSCPTEPVKDGSAGGKSSDNSDVVSDKPSTPQTSPGCGNLEFAMKLWQADSYDVIAESRTDTVAMAVWSRSRLVLAFKGTSSTQNVKTDLNVLKSVHEPKRKVQISTGFTKSVTIPQTPYVHRGFWNSWKKEGFDDRVKNLVAWYIDTYHKGSEKSVEVHVTGHSLGGALATLAAFDIAKTFNVDLTIYTFGQPRVGNKAFATDYDATVPRHFSVAHGQDPVARVPKGSYRKNGVRVHTSATGDVVVAPSSLESHVLNATPELKDHFLESYRKAWMVSIKQQFGPKSLGGVCQSGRAGATALASDMELEPALMASNMDIDSLESYGITPITEEEVAKIKLREEKMRAKRTTDVGETVAAGCSPMLPGCGCRPKTAD